MKVLLTLLDGMRPDALTACGSEFANELLQNTGTYTDGNDRHAVGDSSLPYVAVSFRASRKTRHRHKHIHSAGTSRSGNMRTCACGRKKSSSVL